MTRLVMCVRPLSATSMKKHVKSATTVDSSTIRIMTMRTPLVCAVGSCFLLRQSILTATGRA